MTRFSNLPDLTIPADTKLGFRGLPRVLQPHHENLCQHGDLRYATPERYFLLAGAICFSRVRDYLCVSCSAIRSISERVMPISANSRSLRCESSRLTVSWRFQV